VYAVPNLEEAILEFEKSSGVKPIFGGYHDTQGTKNALVNLSNGAYLELLAIDGSNLSIKGDRWMGVDLISEPKITRWALKTDNIQEDGKILQSSNPNMGNIKGGQRKMQNGKMLTWELTMPLATPEVEMIPFITDWKNSDAHPTDSLPELCTLIELELTHPEPNLYNDTLLKLGCKERVKKGDSPRISIKLKTPKGIIVL